MTSSPEVTAILLNETLKAILLLKEGQDFLFSLQEFAMGIALDYREIDLCYGYCKVPLSKEINTQEPTFKNFESIFGYGISRVTTTEEESKFTRFSKSYQSLNFTDKLPLGVEFQDVYAFANVFLVKSTTESPDNSTPELKSEILKGETSGTPIFMTKELSIDEIIKMSLKNEIPDASLDDISYIKIFDVIMEINYFNSTNPSEKDVNLYFIDKRKPRGWGGFAEEFMGVYLTPSIINKKNDFENLLKDIENNYYNFIKNWINLRMWSPSFIDYWQQNSDLMPEELKTYLRYNFSIII